MSTETGLNNLTVEVAICEDGKPGLCIGWVNEKEQKMGANVQKTMHILEKVAVFISTMHGVHPQKAKASKHYIDMVAKMPDGSNMVTWRISCEFVGKKLGKVKVV